MTFATANARLTSAVKSRLGEPVVFTPVDGAARTVDAVIERNIELVGQDGRVSDIRMAGSFAIADLPETVDGATVRIGSGVTAEDRIVDSVLTRDSTMIKVALR